MLLNHVLLGVLWIVYCVLHSVLAGLRVKDFFRRRLGKTYRHYRLAYTLFAAAGFIALVWFQLLLPSPHLLPSRPLTLVSGGLTALAGLLLMLVCIRKYFLNLSGVRSLVQEELHPVLVVTGVHHYVRHPLYLGTFLFIWGLWLLLSAASLLLSNVIITVYTLVALELEEQKLLLEFGDQYKAYRERVPKLLPKLAAGEGLLRGHR